MKPFTYQKAIDASHPCDQPDGSPQEALSFAADTLAMKLVGEREGKRDLVDLVRWLIMRKPNGLVSPEVERPLPADTEIMYDGIFATVTRDEGKDWIDVECEGVPQRWLWTFNDIDCKVVSLPGAVGD
jgi:hypothetical protein